MKRAKPLCCILFIFFDVVCDRYELEKSEVCVPLSLLTSEDDASVFTRFVILSSPSLRRCLWFFRSFIRLCFACDAIALKTKGGQNCGRKSRFNIANIQPKFSIT